LLFGLIAFIGAHAPLNSVSFSVVYRLETGLVVVHGIALFGLDDCYSDLKVWRSLDLVHLLHGEAQRDVTGFPLRWMN